MILTFDMFCGAGGSSYGASLAGASIVGGIDSWSLAIDVFSDNFPDAKAIQGRVESVDLGLLASKIGNVDLLLASPECTNHSCARGARPRVEASRETALHVVGFAKAIKPRWIVIENVIQMRSWTRYRDLLQGLSREGYRISEHVVDASDYGVPQRRIRLFLLCDRDGCPPRRIPKKRGPKPSALRVLDKPGKWNCTPLENGRRAAATLKRAKRAIQELGPEEPFLIVYYGNDGGTGWQPLTAPLRTVTTRDRFGLCEPAEGGHTLRMLQVPELTRAMGFNDDLILNRGTQRERVMLLGNGVCPPVMAAITDALINPKHSNLQ